MDVATIARRQEFPGEDFIRRRCALEIVNVDDDIDAFLQAGVIDVADTDLFDSGEAISMFTVAIRFSSSIWGSSSG